MSVVAGTDLCLVRDVPCYHIFASRRMRPAHGKYQFALPGYAEESQNFLALRTVWQEGYPREAHRVEFPAWIWVF